MEKRGRLKLAVSGTLAGLVNGLLGGGGGTVLVPMLSGYAGMEEKRAFATSVAVMLPVSAVSAAVYFFRTGFPLREAVPFLLGGAAGGLIGGATMKKAPVKLLRRLFAGFALYGGARSLLNAGGVEARDLGLFWDALAGTVCGVLSGWGVGGGSLLLLYLQGFTGLPQREAQGVNLLYFLPTAGAASLWNGRRGLWERHGYLWMVVPGSAAALGAALCATAINSALLRRFFGIFLLAVGCKMLFQKK